MASKKVRRRLQRQVDDEIDVRYGREIGSIADQMRGTRRDFRTGVRQEKAASRGVRAAVEAVRPTFDRSTGQAVATVDQVRGRLQGDFDKLGPAAAGIVAASARDDEGTRRRLAERLAVSKQDLSQRSIAASTGEVMAIRNLRGQRDTTLQGLRGQLRGIAKEAGSYGGGRLGELLGERADRRVTLHGQNVTAGNANRTSDDKYFTKYGMSRKDFLALPQGKRQKLIDKASDGKGGGSKGPKPATPTQVAGVQDKIDNAVAQARGKVEVAKRKYGGTVPQHERARLQRLLEKNAPPMTVIVDGKEVAVPGRSGLPPRYVSVALDLLIDGGLSRHNKKVLRRRIPGGVRKLDVPHKKKGAQSPSVNAGAGAGGKDNVGSKK